MQYRNHRKAVSITTIVYTLLVSRVVVGSRILFSAFFLFVTVSGYIII